MATFTSVQNGDWNDGATWGNTSPGVKGTDWPGNVGDVFFVGHDVCYNVSETNELGASEVVSRGNLFFSSSANTKLTFAHVDFTIGNSCRLTIGQSGSPIPCSYTAEIIWNTTADNKKGLNSPSGGTGGISFCGDPAYYGSSYLGWMVNTWQGGQTFTMSGDFYDKWIAGQELLVHKFPDAYNDWDTDCALVTISSIWNNGGNTSILISEAAPGSSNVFNAGGPILNLERNVKLSKLGHDTALNSYSTNRPEVNVAEVSSAAVFVCHDMIFAGFHHIECDTGVRAKRNIIRNGYYGYYHMKFCVFDENITVSNNTARYLCDLNEFNNCILVDNYYGMLQCNVNVVNSIMMYSNNQCIRDSLDNDISGDLFDNTIVLREAQYFRTALRAWSNGDVYYICKECELSNGYLGFDKNDVYKPNENDFYFGNYNKNYVKCTVVATPMNILHRNENVVNGGTYFANFDEIPNNLFVAHEFYDMTKNETVTRSGGANYSFKVSPFDEIVHRKHYILEDWYEYDLNAGVEQTRIIYIMGVGWSSFPAADKLCVEAYYYDQSSGCHCGMSVSTVTLTQNSVWTPFTVTFTPVQSWNANYKLYLQAYESTSAHIYVDNQIRDEL